jgi:hypothetical protein
MPDIITRVLPCVGYKYQDFVGISLDWILVEGYSRWKLSSGNLYTFIRPNQEQKQKMQRYVPGRNRTKSKKIGPRIESCT